MEETLEKSVLILDDNILFQRIIKGILEEEGFKVYLADNGKTGLEIFRKENCSVVIVDIFMPVMDGFAFLEEIKPGPDDLYEVIAVTGNCDSETVKKSFSRGASHLLAKPLNFTQVKELVKKAWQKKQLQKKINSEKKAMQKRIMELEASNTTIREKLKEISRSVLEIDKEVSNALTEKLGSSSLKKNIETLQSLIKNANEQSPNNRENNAEKTLKQP